MIGPVGQVQEQINENIQLVSLAAILAINLSGALDTLMTKAKTPHFLQMHSGEIFWIES